AELDRVTELATFLMDEGWRRSFGIFIESPAPIEQLERHLRTFLLATVEGEEGTFYFRFYDPRVLRVYLPTCTPEELAAFFGPITRILVEGEEEDTMVELKRDGAGALSSEVLRFGFGV